MRSLQARAAALIGVVPAASAPSMPVELLPIIAAMVNAQAHPDTLRAIATADTVITDAHQRSFGSKVVRFLVIDKDTSLDLTPLPGTDLELDVIVVKAGVKAALKLGHTTHATSRQEILIDRDARLDLHVAHTDASGTHTRQTVLMAEGAALYDNELIMGAADDLILDNVVVHAAKRTTARVRQCGVLSSGKATATGTLSILPRSKKADSHVSADWLLLSPSAAAIVVPSLEVRENDVKAGHRATVRPIDPHSLFYLQSRGLTIDEARALIIDGFVRRVMEASNG